jgi:hypothetical protein
MPYEKKLWQDRIKDAQGNIIQEGTPFSAGNMNRIEQGIYDAHQMLEKQSQQSTTIGHGLNVINASQNSPLDIKIEGRTLVNMSQNVLDPAKYYVLSDKKSKVKFSDGTTYSGVAKFAGRAEKPILIRVENFEWKVYGSTVENPHKAFNNNARTADTSLLPPSSFTGVMEDSQNAYNSINKLDGNVTPSISCLGDGAIAQRLFSFNLIEAIERFVGKIPATDKLAWLKNNINALTIRWHGYGTSPTGNKASLAVYNNTTSTWVDTVNHTNGSVTQLTFTISGASITDRIDSNGFIHFLSYAEPSNGTVASTIYTDYIELETELKQNAQLWNPRFPIYEVDATEYPNILTTWDENEVMRRYPAVESVQHVQNSYIVAEGENLLPPFAEWKAYAGNPNITAPYKAKVSANDKLEIYVKVKAGQIYSLSGYSDNTDGRLALSWHDDKGTQINSTTIVGNQGLIKLENQTAPSNATQARIAALGNVTTPSEISNVIFNLGSTAKLFIPRNPSMLLIDGVKLGSLADKKDILFKDNGDWKVLKWIEKDVVLDGKLGWSFNSDHTGFKRVVVTVNGTVSIDSGSTFVLTKYDGKKLAYYNADGNGFNNADEAYCFNNFVSITISDTDSGWGETYTPSTNEIKAYFNGWKKSAYAVSNPSTAPTLAATGTTSTLPAGTYHIKYTWVTASGETLASPSASITTTAGQQIDVTLPAFPAGVISANIYISTTSGSETKQGSTTTTTYSQTTELATGAALPSSNTTANRWVSLVDGSTPATNTIEYVSTNLAPNFTPYKLSYVLAKPVTEVVTDKVEGDLVVNGATQVEAGSGFTYTEVDGKRTYTKLTGNQRYSVTANILSIIANYDTSLKSVVDSVVAKQSDIAAQISVNVRAIAELYKRVKALGG